VDSGLIGNPGSDRAVKVINNLTHTKGKFAGHPFDLRPWQEHEIVRPLFQTNEDSVRKYRTCLLMMPRKGGKSEIAAAFAIQGLMFDNELGAEVYSAAADKDQAALVFNVAAQMVRNDAYLSSRLKIIDSQKRIVDHKTGSFYRAISAEAYSKHGFNASRVIYDELHAAPSRELWDVLTTSMGARSQPLTVAISTAGYDRHSILWELYSHAKRVEERPELDPTFLPIIYEAAQDADWTDEAVWKSCNPALGDFRSIEDMRIACRRAQEIPAQENVFKRLFLNIWTEQSERWIDMAAWDECNLGLLAKTSDWKALRERMKGRPCHGGLDLSSRTDLTALALIFDDDHDETVVVPFFWVPEEGASKRSRTDRVPYEQWIKDGLITATPGNVVDQGFIREDINRLAKVYKIRDLAFDPWNATKLAVELDQDGIKITEMRQGFRSLSEPTKHLGALVTGRKLRHGGHPVLRWMASNMVVRQDPNGNLSPDKSKVTERIDGIVATIMGIGAALVNQEREPEYFVGVYGGRG
jgi:phage terminase large subunit-like protein